MDKNKATIVNRLNSIVVSLKQRICEISEISIFKVLIKNISVIYLFIFAVNLVLFNHYVINLISTPSFNYTIFMGVAIYFNPHKRLELLEYLSASMLIGIWFIVVAYGQAKLNQVAKYSAKKTLMSACTFKYPKFAIFVWICSVIVPFSIYLIGHYDTFSMLVELCCLVIMLILPFYQFISKGNMPLFIEQKENVAKVLAKHSLVKNIDSKHSKMLSIFLLVGSICFFCYVFYDPIINQPKIINEYLNIPEQTVLQNKQVIGNTQFWNNYFPSSIMIKRDVSNANASYQNCFASAPENIGIFKPTLENYTFYYNERINTICINGVPSNDSFTNKGGFQKSLYNALQYNMAKENAQTYLTASKIQDDFIKSNEYELRWQIYSRFMIHHNSFMFIPIASFMLHESSASINAQYGLGSAWMFSKLFSRFQGDVSFDSWLKVSYLFYFVYLISLLALVFYLTRSYAWSCGIFLLALVTVNFRGYDFLLLAPGDSPWRHFLDLLVILCLHLYSKRNCIIYYLVALILGVLSVFINPQIGIMIAFACVVAGVFYAIWFKINLRITIASSFIALLLAFLCYIFTSSSSDLAGYYIDGVIGFPIVLNQMLFVFIIIILIYIVMLRILTKNIDKFPLYLLFLIIYSQAIILYVIWHFNSDGYKARGYVYVLTSGLMLFQFKEWFFGRRSIYWKRCVVLFVIVLYLTSSASMLITKINYERIFKKHVTYNWNFDRAHITSVMNPIYFQNGVDLIHKYAAESNGIYIISEYDNILPFLAHKYSLMPFFDLKWYLLTKKELWKTIDVINAQKPQYLFVDTGIDRNLNDEIIDPNFTEKKISGLNEESIWRVQRLKLLNFVYQSVKVNYTLVESGSLISVYKRIK